MGPSLTSLLELPVSAKSSSSPLPLPRAWTSRVKSAILQVISLAQFTMAHTRGWAANSPNSRIRLKADLDRAHQEIALLREELRIQQARMAQLPPHRRPCYPPAERMAILQLRAARNWSLEQAGKAFLVTAETIASWLKRVDEQGPDALVQLPEPVNKYPDFVRYAVHQLKSLCPMLGKMKISQILARAGLHLGVATVGRMLKEEPQFTPPAKAGDTACKHRVVTAKYSGHLWHTDLTVAPTARGFWTAWLPFTLPQCWPFAWWLALAEDHFSRRVMGYAVFLKEPSLREVCRMLDQAVAAAGKAPRHIVCDQGPQFYCDAFKRWCKRSGIKPPRYGAIGKHGSLAVIERLILTLKTLLGCLPLVPLHKTTFRREVGLAITWYNEQRPHMTLGGRTPNEVYGGRFPGNRRPRYEPRERWPRSSGCARPVTLVKGPPGARIGIHVDFASGRRHLPIVQVKRVA